MKFSATAVSAAIVAIGGTSVKVQVQAKNQSPSSKSTKVDAGDDFLKEYSHTEPANFEGVYESCWYSVIRNSASGRETGTFHVCYDENSPDWIKKVGRGTEVIDKTDAFGAYQLKAEINPIEFGGQEGVGKFYQGFAKGDTIHFNSFGSGASPVDDTTNTVDSSTVLISNDTPDTKVCQKRKGGILECTTTLIEYCSPVSPNDVTAQFCEDRVGQWLNTYSISSVLATDIANCPTPPGDFCETKLVPPHPLDPNNTGGSAFGGERHLEDDEDVDGSRHPCPVLARMDA